MTRQIYSALLLLCFNLSLLACAFCQETQPENVLVVYNANAEVPQSEVIAEKYAQLRDIPAKNLLGLTADANIFPRWVAFDNGWITMAEYEQYIRNPIWEKFQERKNSPAPIHYIVLVANLPYKIAMSPTAHPTFADYTVDGLLAMPQMKLLDCSAVADEQSCTYDALFHFTNSIKPWAQVRKNDRALVSRLDGPDWETIDDLLSRGIGEPSPGAEVIVDYDPNQEHQEFLPLMQNTVKLLTRAQVPTHFDQTYSVYVPPSTRPGLGYFSPGSYGNLNLANRSSTVLRIPHTKHSIGTSHVSYNGRFLRGPWPPTDWTQAQLDALRTRRDLIAQIQDYLRTGMMMAIGYAAEPMAGGVARSEVYLPRYLVDGFTSLDAAVAASAALPQTVIIGDPLAKFPWQKAPGELRIEPQDIVLKSNQTLQLNAALDGINHSVYWDLENGSPKLSENLAEDGAYTAGSGSYDRIIVATSKTNPRQRALVHVSVDNTISISVTPPGPLSIMAGSSYQFKVSIYGTERRSIKWYIKEGPIGGTIVDGLYTAPTNAGTFTLVAESLIDPSAKAEIPIYVNSEIDRLGPQFSLPAGNYEYNSPITSLTMRSPDPEAIIRYNNEGKNPSEIDPIFSTPLSLKQGTWDIRAQLWKNGSPLGPINRAFYITTRTPASELLLINTLQPHPVWAKEDPLSILLSGQLFSPLTILKVNGVNTPIEYKNPVVISANIPVSIPGQLTIIASTSGTSSNRLYLTVFKLASSLDPLAYNTINLEALGVGANNIDRLYRNLKYSWSQVSGPSQSGEVFSVNDSATAYKTDFKPDQPGTYKIKCTITDTVRTAMKIEDTITVEIPDNRIPEPPTNLQAH